MASLHKHSSGRSPFFFAKFTGADGRSVVKSTKQRTRSKAMTVALEFERSAAQARDGALTEAQCRKVLSEILERVTGQKINDPSVRDFLLNWIAGKERSKSAGTHLRYSNTVNLFLDSLGGKADKTLVSVSATDFERFRDRELKAGKAGSTVSVDLKTLRSAFNTAFRQGFIPANPVLSIELPRDQRHSRGVFTPDQLRAILKAEDTEWKTATLFGYYVGARLSDAVTMTLENLDFTGHIVAYTQCKTGKQVRVPMHPDLEAHLLALPIKSRSPKAQLTPSLACREIGGRNGLSRDFKDVMAKAKVDDGRIEKEGKGRGRAFSTLSFHALRHSFVSHMANAGVADEIRMKLSGHTNDKVHAGYTKHELAPMKAAIETLPSVMEGLPPR